MASLIADTGKSAESVAWAVHALNNYLYIDALTRPPRFYPVTQ